MDDLPDGWTATEVKQDFTITLFLFSWALLPVGFMLLLAFTTRYATYRLTLAAVALLLLMLAFSVGAGQRRSSLREPRTQLALGSLVSTALSLGVLWALDMEAWWWVTYGLVFGSVATMYVSLNHLSSCNAPVLQTSWPVKTPLPLGALDGWVIQQGKWTNGRMAMFTFDDGALCTMFGSVEGDATYLCLEPLAPVLSMPDISKWGVDFDAFRDASSSSLSEE